MYSILQVPEESNFETINNIDLMHPPDCSIQRSFSSLPVFLAPSFPPRSPIQVKPQSPSPQQSLMPVVRSRKRKLEANTTYIAIMTSLEKHNNKLNKL